MTDYLKARFLIPNSKTRSKNYSARASISTEFGARFKSSRHKNKKSNGFRWSSKKWRRLKLRQNKRC